MGIIQKFASIIRENEFTEVGESQDGRTLWFRKPVSKMRFCIDSLTNSATVFWESGPAQLTSKTFRTVSSLRDWLATESARVIERTKR